MKAKKPRSTDSIRIEFGTTGHQYGTGQAGRDAWKNDMRLLREAREKGTLSFKPIGP